MCSVKCQVWSGDFGSVKCGVETFWKCEESCAKCGM